MMKATTVMNDGIYDAPIGLLQPNEATKYFIVPKENHESCCELPTVMANEPRVNIDIDQPTPLIQKISCLTSKSKSTYFHIRYPIPISP